MALTVDPKAVASQMSGANGINGNGMPGANGTAAKGSAADISSAQGTELQKEFNQALENFSQGVQTGEKGDIRKAQVASLMDPRGAQTAANGKAAFAVAGTVAGSSTLKFSSHAVERMRSRGISFSPAMMKNIEAAVGKAAAKGSKDTLVITGESALIVSVKNGTVVTVMDKNAMKENVFTNIDSTVMV